MSHLASPAPCLNYSARQLSLERVLCLQFAASKMYNVHIACRSGVSDSSRILGATIAWQMPCRRAEEEPLLSHSLGPTVLMSMQGSLEQQAGVACEALRQACKSHSRDKFGSLTAGSSTEILRWEISGSPTVSPMPRSVTLTKQGPDQEGVLLLASSSL